MWPTVPADIGLERINLHYSISNCCPVTSGGRVWELPLDLLSSGCKMFQLNRLTRLAIRLLLQQRLLGRQIHIPEEPESFNKWIYQKRGHVSRKKPSNTYEWTMPGYYDSELVQINIMKGSDRNKLEILLHTPFI